MKRPIDTFFQLLRLAVGTGESLGPVSPEQWEQLLQEAARQRLLGVCFPAVQQLLSQQEIPTLAYVSWEKAAQAIRLRSARHREATREVAEVFHAAGLRNCILKGQAAAALYPQPELRQNGDIDIWVEGERGAILSFLASRYSLHKTRYIHTEVQMLPDIQVEVHFTPSWMFSPFANRRLQKWFASHAQEQFSHADEVLGGACIPTLRFNGTYMLLHIFRHLLEEGIGLRQVMDYYFVLTAMDQEDREAVRQDLRQLGLQRFAGALMDVLTEVFHLDARYLLCPPSRYWGRKLLEAILTSGNFGKTDPTFASRESKTEGILAHGWRKIKRNVRFFLLCPSEVLWMPFHLLWQYLWRRRHGYLYKGR